MECIEKTGQELTTNNHDIVKYICDIEEERKTLDHIIQKQYEERKKVEAEIERLTYKLCLINKSLSMRIKAKNNYDKTLEEITAHYAKLVDSSNKLKQIVEKSQQELDDLMNKKTGTSTGPEGDEVKMLYVKPTGTPDKSDCPCGYTPEVPTKDKKSSEPSGMSDSSRSSSPSKNRRSTDIDNLKWGQNVETINSPPPSVIEEHSKQATAAESNIGSSVLVLSNFMTETDDVFVPPKKPQNYLNACEAKPNIEEKNADTRLTGEESKKILLATIRNSTASQRATGNYGHERLSKIVTSNEGSYLLDDDDLSSDHQLNKLQKRSLHDILNEKP